MRPLLKHDDMSPCSIRRTRPRSIRTCQISHGLTVLGQLKMRRPLQSCGRDIDTSARRLQGWVRIGSLHPERLVRSRGSVVRLGRPLTHSLSLTPPALYRSADNVPGAHILVGGESASVVERFVGWSCDDHEEQSSPDVDRGAACSVRKAGRSQSASRSSPATPTRSRLRRERRTTRRPARPRQPPVRHTLSRDRPADAKERPEHAVGARRWPLGTQLRRPRAYRRSR
jgi:hypothetical protein